MRLAVQQAEVSVYTYVYLVLIPLPEALLCFAHFQKLWSVKWRLAGCSTCGASAKSSNLMMEEIERGDFLSPLSMALLSRLAP